MRHAASWTVRLPWSRDKVPAAVALYDDALKQSDSLPLERLLTLLSKRAREMKHSELQKWTALEINGYLALSIAASCGGSRRWTSSRNETSKHCLAPSTRSCPKSTRARR
jgi:hypothetical protein